MNFFDVAFFKMEEEWRVIEEAQNYSVSNIGNVQNNKTGYNMKLIYDKDGYLVVAIFNNDKKIKRRVHRLVAMAFIENPTNQPLVDHIDRDQTNNNVTNLRWCNHSQNQANTVKKANTNFTSKFKGVCYHKRDKKFQAQIYFNSIKKPFGLF